MENRDIITAGRDDACGKASPSVVTKGRLPAALDGGLALLFLLLVVVVATKPDRLRYKRSETGGFRVFALRKPMTAQIEDLSRSAARWSL